jgi:hypothetical protein
MKVAIMQPYLFPYLGYFQLIRAVDAFVIYDDVNYIKGGWINRNNILAKNQSHLFTLALKNASSNKNINEIFLSDDFSKIFKTLKQNYSAAPNFLTVFPLIERIISQPEKNLASFLTSALQQVCDYLELKPRWYISSELNKDNSLRGQEKVQEICTELGATHYINLSGGTALYDNQAFTCRNIQLSFIKSKSVMYKQFNKDFVANLSIIDVLMFNDKEQCAKLLEEYELV